MAKNMASIYTKKNGSRVVVLSPGEAPTLPGVAQRPQIGLGKVSLKQARSALAYIEEICRSIKTGSSAANATTDWIASLPDSLHKKLAAAGLVDPRNDLDRCTLDQFIEDLILKRAEVKESTVITYRNAQRNLKDCFGSIKLHEVTEQHAHDFRAFLLKEGLAENTVRKRCSIASQFFNAARRAKLITENPFAAKGLPRGVRENVSRYRYITTEQSRAVLAACPDAQWRVIFSLCRWGGMRCPSEVLRLHWDEVDFEGRWLTVHASKTEHHANNGVRKVPLFPEIEHELKALLDSLGGEASGPVVTRYGKNTANLRTQLRRIIVNAGLDPWPKLFQNLRSTRETELFKLTGGNIKAVCNWIGNTPEVAMKHYAQVTESDKDNALDLADELFNRQPLTQTLTQTPTQTPTAKSGTRESKAIKDEKRDFINVGLSTVYAGNFSNIPQNATTCNSGKNGPGRTRTETANPSKDKAEADTRENPSTQTPTLSEEMSYFDPDLRKLASLLAELRGIPAGWDSRPGAEKRAIMAAASDLLEYLEATKKQARHGAGQ